MEIANITIARTLLEGVFGCVQKYTGEPGVNATCRALEVALDQHDYDTTLFMCDRLSEWYQRNIGEIESNEWASYKDEHRRNIDLMDAVTKAFQTHPEWFEGLEGNNDVHKKRMVFISHSSKDKKEVEAFVALLRSMGLDNSNLFCSSCPGFGIPLDESIFDFLKRCFDDYELYVVFLISKQNYYTSPACLNEMGAAWVCGYENTSVLLPGMSPSEMRGAIGSERISIVLDSSEAKYRLNELRDSIIRFLGLSAPSETVWESDRDGFLSQVKCK